jgi:hypothetical protein
MVRPKLRLLVSSAAFHVSPTRAAEAYERVRPELDALPFAQVGRIRANPTAAVTTVFGALPALEALEPAIKVLPHVDLSLLAKLPDYALTLYFTNVLAMNTVGGRAQVAALLVEGGPLRERLLSSAESLALYGHVDAAQVATIRSGAGHLDTANDLGALAQLFRDGGDTLRSKTPVTPAEVDRAAELSVLLLVALGQRRVGSDGSGLPSRYEDERARAFRLVVRAYGEARRVLSFLRWHEGDVDALAPSLFAGKRRRSPAGGQPGNEGGAGEGDDSEGNDGGEGENDGVGSDDEGDVAGDEGGEPIVTGAK